MRVFPVCCRPAALPVMFLTFLVLPFAAPPVLRAQQADKSTPLIVQPGAPGQPTKILPPGTRAQLPPRSARDAEFMRGMIMHHAQAVEMGELIKSRTENKSVRLLGERISKSQSDEMAFMERWLTTRGEKTSMEMRPEAASSGGHHHSHGDDDDDDNGGGDDGGGGHSHGGRQAAQKPAAHDHHHQMPGMLSPEQMEALRQARGTEFDRLFLSGMIQHHGGALVMVKELFDTAGAGQDAEIFNFATDVDSGQRAEIRIMEKMLQENTRENHE